MAQIILLCFILADAFLGLAMADEKSQAIIILPPAPSPSSNNQDLYKSRAPANRKLGRQYRHKIIQISVGPSLSPSMAPGPAVKELGTLDRTASSQPITEENVGVQAQEIHVTKHHHSVNRSVAGGGVILGGLATTFLVAVFCYIRATGRHKEENSSSA